MFERYTEKARRTIFFARYEASQTASTAIEPGHILLGVMREDKNLAKTFLSDEESFLKSIRDELCAQAGSRKPLASSIDMPLSSGAKSVLARAIETSQRLRHPHVDTPHLLFGLLEADGTAVSAALLRQGVTGQKVEAYLKEMLPTYARTTPGSGSPLTAAVGDVAGNALVEEVAARVMDKASLTEVKENFYLLLELLAQKGVITEEEKDKLSGRRG